MHRFTSTATAVEDITALQEGKLGKGLKKFLTDEVVNKGKGKESLLVVDSNLGMYLAHLPRISNVAELPSRTGRSISKKLSINISVPPEGSNEIWRGIRNQLAALLDGLDPKDLATMSLGLSHSLSR